MTLHRHTIWKNDSYVLSCNICKGWGRFSQQTFFGYHMWNPVKTLWTNDSVFQGRCLGVPQPGAVHLQRLTLGEA